jgi:spore coat protein U-like protein
MKQYHLKKIAAVAVALGALGGIGASQGASTSGIFDVTITLNSTCQLGAVTPVTFTYASMGAAVNSNGGSGAFNVTCTNSLPYTFGLQAGTAAAVPPGAATITGFTDNGVNLTYDLALSAAGGSGNGAAQPYNVTGTMAGGQAGTCGLASCTNTAGATTSTNRQHTLILNF